MNGSDDTSERTASGRTETASSNKKMNQSENVKNCKDGACNSKTNTDVDDVAESLGGLDLSNNKPSVKMPIFKSNTGDRRDNIRQEGMVEIYLSDKNDGLYDNDKLFHDPPPKEECPICMLPIPYAILVCGVETRYRPCCGKTICHGCSVAYSEEVNKGRLKPSCEFCRVPMPHSDKENVKRLKKRMKLNDANAFFTLGLQYKQGTSGLPKNPKKAFELWKQAAQLGMPTAHSYLADLYVTGEGVQKDREKTMQHTMIAAMGGHERSRFNLAVMDEALGNMDRAMKHFMIAASSGYDCLKDVGEGYKAGFVTKEQYANTMRAHQTICDEMKSEQRAKRT